MAPVALSDMAYGCFQCQPPTRLANITDKDLKTTIESAEDRWEAGIECRVPGHGFEKVLPACPICGSRILKESCTPPLGGFGWSGSGKTVFWASVMMEMERLLFARLGVERTNFYDHGEYEETVLAPFKKGVLPDKTKPKQHRRLAILLKRAGWLERMLILTD